MDQWGGATIYMYTYIYIQVIQNCILLYVLYCVLHIIHCISYRHIYINR